MEEIVSSIASESYPATERQKEFARNIGIPFDEGISKGEMSKLLDKRLAKIPPSEGQLKLAKELGIRIPWFCSYKRLSGLIDKAMDEEYERRYDEDSYEDDW